MISLLLLSILLTGALPTTHGFETALQFGANNESYVMMMSDLSAASEEMTVCSWVKRMSNHRESWQYWLSYVTRSNAFELCMSDVGQFYFLQDLTRNYSPDRHTVGEWHHLCATWGYDNHTTAIYYDGEMVGTKSTWADRKLKSPGSLMLGQFHWGFRGGKIEDKAYFGGELYDFNIYSKQFDSEEIKEIFNQGRCNSHVQSFEDLKVIRWEDVLGEERHGNVTEALLDCPSIWNILYTEELLDRVIDEDLIQDLKEVKDILNEFKDHKIDEKLIEHLKRHHNI